MFYLLLNCAIQLSQRSHSIEPFYLVLNWVILLSRSIWCSTESFYSVVLSVVLLSHFTELFSHSIECFYLLFYWVVPLSFSGVGLSVIELSHSSDSLYWVIRLSCFITLLHWSDLRSATRKLKLLNYWVTSCCLLCHIYCYAFILRQLILCSPPPFCTIVSPSARLHRYILVIKIRQMVKCESQSLRPHSMWIPSAHVKEEAASSAVERQPGRLVWVYLIAYGNCVGRARAADYQG